MSPTIGQVDRRWGHRASCRRGGHRHGTGRARGHLGHPEELGHGAGRLDTLRPPRPRSGTRRRRRRCPRTSPGRRRRRHPPPGGRSPAAGRCRGLEVADDHALDVDGRAGYWRGRPVALDVVDEDRGATSSFWIVPGPWPSADVRSGHVRDVDQERLVRFGRSVAVDCDGEGVGRAPSGIVWPVSDLAV